MNTTNFVQTSIQGVHGPSFHAEATALRDEQHVERSQSSPPKYSNDWLIAAIHKFDPEADE
jgi:hypothetical protein